MNMMRASMSEGIVNDGGLVCDIVGKAADAGETVELKYLMEIFTNDVFTKVGFGVDLNYLKYTNHGFFTCVDRVSELIKERTIGTGEIWKLQRMLNLDLEKQRKEDMTWIDKYVYRIINKSIAKKKEDSVESQKAQIKSLRGMAIVFLSAGRSTTTNSMDWLVTMLAQNPHVQDKIRAELRAKLPNLVSGTIKVLAMEQIGELTYLEATIRESLRLNPAIPLTTRVAQQDMTLSDGTFLKKGTIVMVPIYAMGRMQHLWGEDAAEFKSERWTDSKTGKLITVSPFKSFAFCAGPRICLGKNFSFMEMKMLTVALLSKFEFATEEDPHTCKYHATLALNVVNPLEARPKRITLAAF